MQPNLQYFLLSDSSNAAKGTCMMPAGAEDASRAFQIVEGHGEEDYCTLLLTLRPETELVGVFGQRAIERSGSSADPGQGISPTMAPILERRYPGEQLHYLDAVESGDLWRFLSDEPRWAALAEGLEARYGQPFLRQIPLPSGVILRADHLAAWQSWFLEQSQQLRSEIAELTDSDAEVRELYETISMRVTGWFLAQRYRWEQVVPIQAAPRREGDVTSREATERDSAEPNDLPSITVREGDEEKTIFTLPFSDRGEWQSGIAFAVRKSGSVMLNRILKALCEHRNIPFVSIPDAFFRWGVPLDEAPEDTSKLFKPNGYFYGGFRRWPVAFDIPILSTARSVLLLRDPRDRLVSDYYSMRESHSEPGKSLRGVREEVTWREKARSMDIDAYVREMAPSVRTDLERYRDELCAKYPVKIYRYEDVIYNKRDWIGDLVSHYGWDVPADVIAEIAAENDVIPESEDTANHVRQVHPGNYRDKLSPATIDFLTDYFQGVMGDFGYNLGR